MGRKKSCLVYHERIKASGAEKCLFCDEKLNLSFKEQLAEKVKLVPHSTRQKILDLLREGKTVGDVCKAVELETIVVGEVIMQNMSSIHILNDTAK